MGFACRRFLRDADDEHFELRQHRPPEVIGGKVGRLLRRQVRRQPQVVDKLLAELSKME